MFILLNLLLLVLIPSQQKMKAVAVQAKVAAEQMQELENEAPVEEKKEE
jgi:hypothetical protein